MKKQFVVYFLEDVKNDNFPDHILTCLGLDQGTYDNEIDAILKLNELMSFKGINQTHRFTILPIYTKI